MKQPASSTSDVVSGTQLSPAQRLYYLDTMGIQLWQSRQQQEEIGIEQTALDASESTSDIKQMDWQQLEQMVSGCTLCELHQTRTHAVFGTGDKNARLMFIGEAPGADEDEQGEPFVGRAGQLLNQMLKAIGLQRDSVYIANILKCRPPNNRDPRTSESLCCDPYLQRQIELINPDLIIALGRVAAQHLLVSRDSMGQLRGHDHQYKGIPLQVMYHPAYLLRTPLAKREAWHDLLKVKRRLAGD